MAERDELAADSAQGGSPRWIELVGWAAFLWVSEAAVDFLIGGSSLDGTWAEILVGILVTSLIMLSLIVVLSKRYGLLGKDSYRVMRDVLIMFAINFAISLVLDAVLLVLDAAAV